MAGIIDSRQADALKDVLCRNLQEMSVTEQTDAKANYADENTHFLNCFIAGAKTARTR
jgi:hypothetical protein